MADLHPSVVGAVGASAFVHHMFMSYFVVKARKQYKVEYPDLYANAENCTNAENRKKFNCVQRAHQNSLESLGSFMAMVIAAGAKYPVTSSVAAWVYLLGRVWYFVSYSSGVPSKREKAMIPVGLGLVTLLGICVRIGVGAIIKAVQGSEE